MSKFSKKFMGRSPFTLSDSTRNAMASAGTKGSQKAAMMVAKTKETDAITEGVNKLGEKVKEAKEAKDAKGKDSPMKKTPEERIRGRKGGRTASVTNRLNEGNIKGARLARRTAAAGSKSKKDRLQRKVDAQDSKFFKDQVDRRREK